MKNTFKQALIVMVAMAAWATDGLANPITRDQARERAEQFLTNGQAAVMLQPVTDSRRLAPRRQTAANQQTSDTQTTTPYYVFDRGENEGFVIVSGDDSTVPVLGYTDSGSFDYEDLPCGLKALLDNYAADLETIRQQPLSAAARVGAPMKAPYTPQHHPVVAPLLNTIWGQSTFPFNMYTPENMPAGCVAVGMAMVMYYHRYASTDVVLEDIPDWKTFTGIPKGTVIDWPNVMPTYNSRSTDAQNQAVGNLIHICGAAVEMSYTHGGSGSNSTRLIKGATTYLGYNKSMYRQARSGYTPEEWDQLVYNELTTTGPVYCTGNGHAYVCDGYDGKGLYHINWGWRGGSDGYYYIGKLTIGDSGINEGQPGEIGYTSGFAILLGFKPEINPDKAITFSNDAAGKLCLQNFDADNDGKLTFREAAAVEDIGQVFKGSRITSFPELAYFTGLTTIAEDAFKGCAAMTDIQLPPTVQTIASGAFSGCSRLRKISLHEGITAIGESAFLKCSRLSAVNLPLSLETIGNDAFNGCSYLEEMELTTSVKSIGDHAFANCTKLKDFTSPTLTPSNLTIGEEVFSGCKLIAANLYVAPGTRAFYANDPQWQQFAYIIDSHALTAGAFTAPEEGKEYYLYNVGTGRYLTRGELYNTQAVAGHTPMKIQLTHREEAAEDIYSIATYDFNIEKPWLYRSDTDKNAGEGITCVFVNGTEEQLNLTGDWRIAPAEDGTYTIQIPNGSEGYAADLFCGIQPAHANYAFSPTYALYTDIPYEGNEANCQWAFIEVDQDQTLVYTTFNRLRSLLTLAKKQRTIDSTEESAVCQNPQSTCEEMLAACTSLCDKLGLLDLQEPETYTKLLATLDIDLDNQVSYAEATRIESLGNLLQGLPVKNLNCLKHFSNLVILEDNALMGCNELTTISLPANLRGIGANAFSGCEKLEQIELPEYVAQIHENSFQGCSSLQLIRLDNPVASEVVIDPTAFSDIQTSDLTLQIPEGTREDYEASDIWRDFGTIEEVEAKPIPPFSAPVAEVEGYLYNLGTRRYLRAGEAWATQAVVGAEGFVYVLHKASSSGDTFYMDSKQVSKTNKTMFRSTYDSRLGDVKCCFADGTVTASNVNWIFKPVEGKENVYTLNTPSTISLYVEGECLGILPTHALGYDTIDKLTYGLYWDVPYEGNELNCQWAFITKEDYDATYNPVVIIDAIEEVSTTNQDQPTQRYNLQGQRVGNDYKGVVIIEGKKVLIK